MHLVNEKIHILCAYQIWEDSVYSDMAKNRLREFRQKDLGIGSMIDMAERLGGEDAGWYHQRIQRLETGKTDLTDDVAWEIAEKTGRPIYALFVDPAEIEKTKIALTEVNVIGEIRAGSWQEAVEWEDDKIFSIPYAPPPQYDGKAYGLEVVGDSMNLVYPEGTIVVVVPIWEYQSPIMSGKRVIVERTKKDGTVEATAKELEIIDGHAKLWPKSTNPRFSKALDICWPYESPQDLGLETVEIKGVIVGAYRNEE